MPRFVLDCTAAQMPDWWRPGWPLVKRGYHLNCALPIGIDTLKIPVGACIRRLE